MGLPSTCTLAAVIGAGCIYSPGSYHGALDPFAGMRVALPCLDLAVTLTDDPRATAPVVQYSFGNRCFHAVEVDLSRVRAIGRFADGDRALEPYDPHHELRALRLDALWRGDERIEYLAAAGPPPASVCVDVGELDRSAPVAGQWVCLATWSQAGSQP